MAQPSKTELFLLAVLRAAESSISVEDALVSWGLLCGLLGSHAGENNHNRALLNNCHHLQTLPFVPRCSVFPPEREPAPPQIVCLILKRRDSRRRAAGLARSITYVFRRNVVLCFELNGSWF